MTQEARNIALGLGVVLILLFGSCVIKAQTKAPRYYDEQLLNYRYSRAPRDGAQQERLR